MGIDTTKFSAALAQFDSEIMKANINHEKQINEIAAITGNTPEEVKEFFKSHSYSLEYLKEITLAGSTLNDDSMRRTLIEILLPRRLGELTIKKTFTDYLSNIPFYTGYWLSYPFVWLVYWIKEGMLQAKEEVWD